MGHETRDISVRLVAWVALGLIVAAIIMHVGVAGLFYVFKQDHPSPETPSRITEPRVIAPEPRLQNNPSADLAQFRTEEESKLNSYGWIDKEAGVIRIPIQRAMDLIGERGLPARGPGIENSSGKTPQQMQQEKAAATKP
ncbi:MAG: hypothetical protein ACR2FX_10495 [Chthoniobacterales bacterium]